MPTRPPRKGFGEYDDGHRGWRDKVGMTFRPGRSTFVLVAHGQWGSVPPVKLPARLFRAFHYKGDRLGKFRLDAEYAWCLNHAMLVELGADVMRMVPNDILGAMSANPRLVVETNWPVADEFETVTGDVEIVRLAIADLVACELPEDDADAAGHCGTLLLAITPGGALKQHMHADKTWHNYAIGWVGWSDDKTLEDLVPPELLGSLPKFNGLQPISAEYSAGPPRFVEVPAGGGPTFGADGEQIHIGANEVRIYGQKVRLDDGTTTALYIDGNPYEQPLSGIEMIEHGPLATISTDAATLNELALPIEKRNYLNLSKELMPGWRRITFRREQIVSQFISVNPSLLESVDLLPVGEVHSFEGKVVQDGKFQPLRRVGERLAASWTTRIVVERGLATREGALRSLQELIIKRSAAAKALDPLEINSNGPWPFEQIAVLSMFSEMRRSPTERHRLSVVLRSDDHPAANLGLLAHPAPLPKEPRGYLSMAVPQLPDELLAGAVLDPRKVKGIRKHEINYISISTETRELTMRLSWARFNGSKRVRGASIGAPPKDPPAQGSTPGKPMWKYSLLARAWVPWATPAPTPKELRVQYPGLAAWAHW